MALILEKRCVKTVFPVKVKIVVVKNEYYPHYSILKFHWLNKKD
jgi:hypothetical protein